MGVRKLSKSRRVLFATAVLTAAVVLAAVALRAEGPADTATTFPLAQSDLLCTRTLASVRAEKRAQLESKMALAFANPAPDVTSATVRGQLMSGLYIVALLEQPMANAVEPLRSLLSRYSSLDEDLGYQALTAAYQYRTEFNDEMSSVALETTVPRHFCLAVKYLLRSKGQEEWKACKAAMATRWPNWENEPQLKVLSLDAEQVAPLQRPALASLLCRNFAPGSAVLYSLQRPNRDYEGLVLLRRRDGLFARNSDGVLWHVPQLTRSNGSMPSYIRNGNTPQGVFTIKGTGVSNNSAIGLTPFLETCLPVEAPPDVYFNDPSLKETSWTQTMYRDFLPADWRDYWPMQVAWYAGAVGRYDMLCHGTTIDPSYYVGMPWYPNTPSQGCLTCKEFWDTRTGRVFESDQLALYNGWLAVCRNRHPYQKKAGEGAPAQSELHGYCVVVELNDLPSPVTLSEVLADVYEAESIRR